MLNIKKFENYKITKIEKGWSDDVKYLLEKDDEKLLVKVADIKFYERKKSEFLLYQQLEKHEILSNLPVDFGLTDDKSNVYMALTWVEGADLREKLINFTKEDQYDFGIEAGKILKKIHGIPIEKPQENWADKFNKKIDRNIMLYDNCEFKYPHGELFLNYIIENRNLLNTCKQTLHHGDFHEGNLILTPENKVLPIDFNRFDYGDPWEEFNRIVWSKDLSPEFASGQIDGYFKDVVPEDFWKLLLLYISSNTIGSLPWAVPFGEGEVTTMMNQAAGNLKDYDFMKTYIPRWYQQRGI